MTSPPLAALITMSEDDYQWCCNLQRAEHAAFSIVVDYLRKAVVELDAQSAAAYALRLKVATLEAERDEARGLGLECMKCGFGTNRMSETDCPNDGTVMTLVTWKDRAISAAAMIPVLTTFGEAQKSRADELQAALTSARLAREEALRETADAKHQLALTINLFGTADTKREAAEAEARTLREKVDERELELRKGWWVGHGCPVWALYGDDGEFQCSKCGHDFKLEPFDELRKHVYAARLAAAAAALTPPAGEEQT